MNKPLPNSFRQGPDARGRFGEFGGRFVAETLMPLILEVERAYEAAKRDTAFQAEWRRLLTHYVGRPSPMWYAERLTTHLRAKAAPDVTGRTSAPSSFIRKTLGCCRSTSVAPI